MRTLQENLDLNHRELTEELCISVGGLNYCLKVLIEKGLVKMKTSLFTRISLATPTQGLLIGNMVWREMHDFSLDCVLLVLASEHYDESDYNQNYQDFICLLKYLYE
jgi:hypothetical protein